jgi:hypothetical protein
VLVIFDRDPNVSFERFADFKTDTNWQFSRVTPSLGMPHWEYPQETISVIETFYAQC